MFAPLPMRAWVRFYLGKNPSEYSADEYIEACGGLQYCMDKLGHLKKG